MKNGVYQIRNIANQKIYIGSCSSKVGFKDRWRRHLKDLSDNKHHSHHLQHAWNKYGKDKFRFEILEECSPVKCLIREQFYLDNFEPDYNVYDIAGSPLGRVVSDLTKIKISKSLMGSNLSDETKSKISLSLKGKPKSPLHISKVRDALWGKNGKLRIRKGGRFLGYYKFLNTETTESVICGRFELADKYSMDRSRVYKMCNGRVKSCRGWICLGKIERE